MSLHYHLSSKGPSLFIRIQIQTSKRVPYFDTLKPFAKEEDLEAISLLKKEFLSKKALSSLETTPFQEIEMRREKEVEILFLLAKTNRLFFQKEAVFFEEKTFSKLHFFGQNPSEEACTISCVLQVKEEEIPLERVTFLTPSIGIFEQKLFVFEMQGMGKWISLLKEGPKVFEGKEKRRFLEEDIKIFWKKEKEIYPTPFLQLTDPTGCFVNLWMEYEGLGKVCFDDLSPTIQGKLRRKEEEISWEKDLIEGGFSKKKVGSSSYFCEGDKAKETLLFFLDLGWKIYDFKERKVFKQSESQINVKETDKGFALSGELSFQEKKCSLKQALLSKSSLWLIFDESSVGLVEKIPKIEGVWEDETLLLEKSDVALLKELEKETKLEPSLKKLTKALFERENLEEMLPSQAFKGKLLPYQQKGLNFIHFLYRSGYSLLLADEMGLGKTVQVLAFFSLLKTNFPTLVVVPSSLIYHWKAELFRFLPSWKVLLHTSAQKIKTTSEMEGVDCVLTSYALLRQDGELFSSPLFEVIVLDESNAIKSFQTLTAKSAFRLKGVFKMALTGTPIENRAEELWSQFHFIMPNLLKDKKAFQALELTSLKKKVMPFILKRTKEEVEIELPEKREEIVLVEMTEGQKRIYDNYLEKMGSKVLEKVEKEGITKHRMEVLEVILRLRQIAIDPRLVGEEEAGSKLELILEDLQDKKVLIYSQFTKTLSLLQKELEDRDLSYFYLDGTLSSKERMERVTSFQETSEEVPFLISLKAGGVGLNLTRADYVFLIDPWWNEAVENQAIARSHRIGQKRSVFAKRYISINSIEEKILTLKEKKKALANHLIDDSGVVYPEEDLLFLLES